MWALADAPLSLSLSLSLHTRCFLPPSPSLSSTAALSRPSHVLYLLLSLYSRMMNNNRRHSRTEYAVEACPIDLRAVCSPSPDHRPMHSTLRSERPRAATLACIRGRTPRAHPRLRAGECRKRGEILKAACHSARMLRPPALLPRLCIASLSYSCGTRITSRAS